jgi:predicted Zn finger-like uncharacterized protein
MPTVLICPNCSTRYETAAVIPPEGRKVRCSKCNTVWTAMRDAGEAAIEPRAAAAAPSLRAAAPSPATVERAASQRLAQESPPYPNGGRMSPPPSPEDDITFRDREQDPAPDERVSSGAEEPRKANGHGDYDASFDAAMDEEPRSEPSVGEGADDRDPYGYDPYSESSYGVDADAPADSGHGAGRAIVAQPERDDAPREIRMSSASSRKDRARRPASPLVGWLLLLLVVGSLAALVALAPSSVVRFLPGAAPYYQALGVDVNTRGLSFANVAYDIVYEGGGGQLEVSGDITNLTGSEIQTPTVVFSLRNADGEEVQQYTANVFQEPLAGGATQPFAARMPAPDATVRSVEVTFAPVP